MRSPKNWLPRRRKNAAAMCRMNELFVLYDYPQETYRFLQEGKRIITPHFDAVMDQALMATRLTISQENAQAAAAPDKASPAGLTAEPDSLTAVLDSIEQSVAQAARP